MANPVLFGAGSVTLIDLTNPSLKAAKPVAILKDVAVDFDASQVELVGAYQMPIDIARGGLKVTGKAKFAWISGGILKSVLTGATVTTGQTLAAWNESHAIGATVVATQIGTPNSHPFAEELGLIGTDGQFWTRESGSGTPSAVKTFTLDESTGTYRFHATDVSAGGNVLLNYAYTVATGNTLSWNNQLMGSSTVFQINVFQQFRTVNIGFKFPACIVPKLSFAFKNGDYAEQDLDFAAFADPTTTQGFQIYYP